MQMPIHVCTARLPVPGYVLEVVVLDVVAKVEEQRVEERVVAGVCLLRQQNGHKDSCSCKLVVMKLVVVIVAPLFRPY